MKRAIPMLLLLAFTAMVGFGCAGDVATQALATPELQAKVMDMIGGNADMAGTMVDKLLAGANKQAVMDKLMANSELVQGVVDKITKDPTMLENVLNTAVQDPAMRAKVVAFVKGLKPAK